MDTFDDETSQNFHRLITEGPGVRFRRFGWDFVRFDRVKKFSDFGRHFGELLFFTAPSGKTHLKFK